MLNVSHNLKIAVAAAALAAFTATAALAVNKKVRRECEGDYDQFCSQYAPESAETSRCFESNRKNLSRPCIRALVDAGEVPARYLKK